MLSVENENPKFKMLIVIRWVFTLHSVECTPYNVHEMYDRMYSLPNTTNQATQKHVQLLRVQLLEVVIQVLTGLMCCNVYKTLKCCQLISQRLVQRSFLIQRHNPCNYKSQSLKSCPHFDLLFCFTNLRKNHVNAFLYVSFLTYSSSSISRVTLPTNLFYTTNPLLRLSPS